MLHAGDDQERRVREALKKGKTTRDIAKEERMSLTPIIAIRKKLFGVESREQNKFSQALALFSKGRKLTEVAIKLKLSAEVAEKYYKDFWALEHMTSLTNLYFTNKQTIPYLMRLYKLLKKKGFSSKLYNDVFDLIEKQIFRKDDPALLPDNHIYSAEELERAFTDHSSTCGC